MADNEINEGKKDDVDTHSPSIQLLCCPVCRKPPISEEFSNQHMHGWRTYCKGKHHDLEVMFSPHDTVFDKAWKDMNYDIWKQGNCTPIVMTTVKKYTEKEWNKLVAT